MLRTYARIYDFPFFIEQQKGQEIDPILHHDDEGTNSTQINALQYSTVHIRSKKALRKNTTCK